MRRALPKQFLEVHGKPIIVHTLEKFEEHDEIDAIAIAIVGSHREHLNRLLKIYDITKVKWIVDGGDTGRCRAIGLCRPSRRSALRIRLSSSTTACAR